MTDVRSSIGHIRLIGLAVVTAGLLALMAATAGPALAGSDQSCSQRGGKDNSAKCTSLINVGDVDITLKGNRILTDNEVTLIETGTINVLNNSLNCVQIIAVLSNNCAKDVANTVIVIVKGFDTYVLNEITVVAFGQKYYKKCGC